MKLAKSVIHFVAVALAFNLLLSATTLVTCAATSDNNRFNVMVVLDASGSMNDTDPTGLRFDAISQFTNLLAEHGNYLGGIVFSTDILFDQAPVRIDSQQDKEQFVQQMNDVTVSGWTNTGDALAAAVNNLLTSGDPNLPSVIVFLSDGNTTLGNTDDTEASLNVKAEAIQTARENDIAIYSICLNADQSADITEMEQISGATGGVFQEVSDARDLGEVFNTFYNLIYGTSTITLVDDIFPDNGIVEKEFEVPGIGVEEVNIIIYGTTSNLALFKPDGTESSPTVASLNSLTMIKITDIMPGTWRIVTTGVPGDKIKINMVYNTNLGVDVYFQPAEDVVTADTELKILAQLRSGDVTASSSAQYDGYSAVLHVLDAYEDEISAIPMYNVDDHFEAVPTLGEGIYKFKVSVTGSYAGKESEVSSPLTIIPANESVEEEPVNTPPQPVEDPVQKTVYIWPFMDNSVEIDMATLATDAEDSQLRYKILSSSFIEGTDYSVSGDKLVIDHFSLSKGAFTVRATDVGGLSCEIEVIIKAYNIGLITLIGMGILALTGAIIFGILLYVALTKPFRGTISAQSYCNGSYKGTPRSPRRGREKLARFGMDNVGLDYQKCYFQATGKNYIYLITNQPVIWNGQKTNKVRIQGGAEATISIHEGDSRLLYVRFDSRMRGAPRRPTARTGHRPTQPRRR